jgi:hypothetical protein
MKEKTREMENWTFESWLGKGGLLIKLNDVKTEYFLTVVHIMAKEYSNTLRKREMNGLGKVVHDDALQCGRSTGYTRPLTFYTLLWHIKTWNCYQTNNILHFY